MYDGEENYVEFHLLYTGKLHVNGDRKEKHAIRKALHPQLRRLWQTNHNLRRKADHFGRIALVKQGIPVSDGPVSVSDHIMKNGFLSMGTNWSRNGFNFVPLVTSDAVVRCSLDILFLRAEERNYVLQGGDIDGRLKTLFDGLRMIREGNELPTGTSGPDRDEDPFFCLLENDDLISEVNVNANQLLLLPNSNVLDPHDVYLQITVKLNASQVGLDPICSW